MENFASIEMAKLVARKANELGDFSLVEICIKWLDENWHDHAAAMKFYTELEQAADSRADLHI